LTPSHRPLTSVLMSGGRIVAMGCAGFTAIAMLIVVQGAAAPPILQLVVAVMAAVLLVGSAVALRSDSPARFVLLIKWIVTTSLVAFAGYFTMAGSVRGGPLAPIGVTGAAVLAFVAMSRIQRELEDRGRGRAG
jgi:hypothetical protein